jgi:3,4-dihydroxy 2-butanone 4-phosphate synthase/GTP cyclohydrolase II
VVSIADLVEYRLQRDRLVSREAETEVDLNVDDLALPFKAYIYRALPGIKRQEYVALVAGDISDGRPVPVRAHVGCVADDLFGARTRTRSPSIREIISAIARRGRGIVLYLPPRETLETELMMDTGRKTREVRPDDRNGEIREYGIGAQILLDLGVTKLKVISNNPHKLVGLEGWGFESVEQITLEEV